MICEEIKKEARVLQRLGEKHGSEFALCLRNHDVLFVRGGRRSVRIPSRCDVVLHNHPTSPRFSEQDLKESEKTVVCVVHKNTLKCAKDRKLICEASLEEEEEVPKMKLTFDHHDARFNLLEIAKQLALLEEHYSRDEMRCGDCMVKHLLLIQGYAEEGMRLEHGEEYAELFKEAVRIVDEHKKMLEEGTLRESAIEELRELRKKIFQALNVFELEEKTWHGLPVKHDKWDWDLVKPKLPSQRWEVKEKYGDKCFLRPDDLGFPICNVHGQLDCDGLRAAYVRARALVTASKKVGREDIAREYERIAERALSIAKEVGCGWASK
ncbi:MAG: hypothetical protein QXT64_02450 [Desulfurococcaceae archaeon]